MRLEVSNKFDVHCDICGDAMQKQADVYACYPCRHMVWASEIPAYHEHVRIKETNNDSNQCS